MLKEHLCEYCLSLDLLLDYHQNQHRKLLLDSELWFTRGVAGFIETQQGIRFLQQVIPPDAAAVLYDADLPRGTLRFAEFFRFGGGQIASIKLLYDPGRYTAFGGR